MPLARIVTRAPETAGFLADYLARRGYTVEIATPQQHHTSAAELEISVETCTRQQAYQRASQLASSIGADVVVAPGVLPTKAARIAEQPQAPQAAERGQSFRETLFDRMRAMQIRFGEWRRANQVTVTATSQRCKGVAQQLSREASVVAAKWLRVGAQRALTLWQLIGRYTERAVATGRAVLRQTQARLHQARLKAEQNARQRTAAQARLRELERERPLAQPQPATEQPAEHASSFIEPAEETEIIAAPPPAVPLRRPPKPRSSLVAYTRNRDWKMAFMGAVAASLLIMVVSFGFMKAAPPAREAEQKLPFGAATVQASAPTLITPAPELDSETIEPEGITASAQPVVDIEPVTTAASQAQPDAEEDQGDEVVIRHYQHNQSVKAQVGKDGVKRISDLD